MSNLTGNMEKCSLSDATDAEQNDETDARKKFGWLSQPPNEGVITGSILSRDYSMNYPKRGRCLIFNNKTFEPHTGLNVRNGTDADGARLYCRFKELQFDVTLYSDLTVKEIDKELQKAAKEDHSNNSSFVCCILSHGEQGILFGADGKYPTERVFSPFRGDACPTLAGKPKIFFIQACQGDKLDSGVHITKHDAKDSDDGGNAFRIPTHADFLIVFSTVPGFYSWRNTTNGSWFIQSLCAVLQKHVKEMDLLQLLTIVNFKVAYEFESYVPNDTSMHLKKQIPFVTSTLTRNIKFPVP